MSEVQTTTFSRPQRLALTKGAGWANVSCTVIGLLMRSPIMHHTHTAQYFYALYYKADLQHLHFCNQEDFEQQSGRYLETH